MAKLNFAAIALFWINDRLIANRARKIIIFFQEFLVFYRFNYFNIAFPLIVYIEICGVSKTNPLSKFVVLWVVQISYHYFIEKL